MSTLERMALTAAWLEQTPQKQKLKKPASSGKASLPEPTSTQAPNDFCRTFLTQAEN
jgi:hypothetical protein